MFTQDDIYQTPHLIPSDHFPNYRDKGSAHSRDPRNCPVVLFFDGGHYTMISFLLRDPVIVMPIFNFPSSKGEIEQCFGCTKKKNLTYTTYRTIVHNFVYRMMINIEKHRNAEEAKNQKIMPRVIRRKGAKALRGTAAYEKRARKIRRKNVEIDFTLAKMSKYLH